MIHALIVLAGFAWVLGHWAWFLLSLALAAGTTYLCWHKGLLAGIRGGALCVLCCLLGLDGLVIAGLLRGRTQDADV